jgi:hypothetical protein
MSRTLILVTILTILAIIFNHITIDAYISGMTYSLEGELGSIAPPVGLANDLRAWTIDVILLGQLLLIAKLLKK